MEGRRVSPRRVPPSSISRARAERRGKARRSPLRVARRWASGAGYLISLALVVLVIAAGWAFTSLSRDLPALEELETLLDPLNGQLRQPTRLYDRSGAHLLAVLAPADGERIFLTYEQIPPDLVNATLALAQPDFWESPGYLLAGWQGATPPATLAQHLAADLLLADEPASTIRNLRERLLAARMTAAYGCEQVLAWVLNSNDYGNHAYGVEAAALLYLGKSATQVSLSEAALLAAVGQAPALNPFDAPQAAEEGRRETLARMLTLGWLTPAQAQAAAEDVPLLLPAPAADPALVSPQFIDLVLSQVDAALGGGRAERGAAVILTTIDYALQVQTDCTLRTQIARLSGMTEAAAPQDGSDCTAALLLPWLQADLDAGDLSAGAVLLDPASGQVLAAAGDLSPQPAGTAITPFIYLTGFARGLNPASLGWDIPAEEPVLGQVYQGPVRLRIALGNDYLPPALTVIGQVGMQSIQSGAASFGLEFPAGDLLEAEFYLPPVDLAFACATLASEGLQNGQSITGQASLALQPAGVLQVLHGDGSTWLDWSLPRSRSVVSPELAYLMNHVLSDDSARWATLGNPNVLEIGIPAAVKAGRSLDEHSAWTLGYTPDLVVVTWLSGAGSSSRAASDGLWSALTRHALQGKPASSWEMPPGVVTLQVCDPSGYLPTDTCPNVVSEVFLDGRQPVQVDHLFQEYEINIETGLLATVFTPPELVESRVYMVTPPEARAWAQEAGMDTPPTSYDRYQPPPYQPEIHITTPEMFADVSGMVEFHGTAAGEDFVSYRLEYGPGLNPQAWFLLGSDAATPVTEGLLGSWDTTGLEGLYTLRLMVIRSGDRVEQALVQLTLDNTPPEVQIFYPQEGDVLSLEDGYLAIQAQAEDALLEWVVFYMDGEELGRLDEAPFGVIWKMETGTHAVRVVAVDRAGNTGEAEMRITVGK
jgi:membrane carboxypeptidase/penicillin-binding protein